MPGTVNGDGTVTLAGADYKNNDAKKRYYVKADHLEIAGSYFDHITKILKDGRTNLPEDPFEPKKKSNSINIYNPNSQFFTEGIENRRVKQNNAQEQFNPRIVLEYEDGSRFIFEDGKIKSNPHDAILINLDSTISVIVEESINKLDITNTEAGVAEIGVLLNHHNGDDITKTLDYQNIDLSGNKFTGSFSEDLSSSSFGLDNDNDGQVDQLIDHEVLQPINFNSASPDPTNPPENENPEDGSVQIEVTGTDGNNNWKISEVNISASTSIQLPEENDSNESGADQTDQRPEISFKIDEGSEISYSGPYTYSEDGKHLVTAYVKDKEGKMLGLASKSFKIDRTNPQLETQVAGKRGENGWITSDAQLSIGATDETSKLARVDYSLDGSGYVTYDTPIDVREEGTHTFAAEAEDNAGNIENDSTSFKIDKSKPVISNVYLQDEYFWGQEFPIQFEVNDAVSGVGTVNATINGKAVTNGSKYRFTEPGWHTYRIEVKDQAGWKAVYETKFEVYIPAKITFHPESLQLDHGNGMATNYIELPAPFEPEKMNFATVKTNGKVVHVQDPKYGYVKNPFDDFDKNGIRDMMLKYERESLVNVIEPKGSQAEKDWANGDITMFGEWDIYHFKGYDSIQVKNSGYMPPPPDVTPPSVAFIPVNGSENVSVDVTPTITFSEPVILKNGQPLTDASALGIVELQNSSSQMIPFTVNWMKNTLTMQVNPTVQLEGLVNYRLTLKPNTVTDSVYNGNELFSSSFTTESYLLHIQPPLPIPVIEEEEDAYTPTPIPTPPPTPQPPTPATPPPIIVTPTEQQVQFNQLAANTIASAGDGETVIREVDKVLDRIKSFTDSDSQSLSDKLDVITNTVDTVMVAVIDKMKQGAISESEVKDHMEDLLQQIIQPVIGNIGEGNKADIDKSVKAVSNLTKKVVSRIDKLNDLSDEVADAMNSVLAKENAIRTQKDVVISGVQDAIITVATHVNEFLESLGEHADEVTLEKKLHLQVQSEAEANLQIESEILQLMGTHGIQMNITTESFAGMELPNSLLKQIGANNLQAVIQKTGTGKNSRSINTSDEYEFVLKSGKDIISEFGNAEVTVSLPIKGKMPHPQAMYFDEQKKRWVPVQSSKGEAVEVEKKNGIARFKTPHFTKFKLSDALISKITVEPSRTHLEPGQELQLKVTAVINKKNVDVTSGESGTSYISSKPDVVTVDDNGLLQVAEAAKEGAKVTITVKNGGKTGKVTLSIAIKKVTSVAVTPKKVMMDPGSSQQLSVVAKLSDGSTSDVTSTSTGTIYQSSDEEVATVSENGIVSMKEGAKQGEKVIITVTHGGKTSRCTITVK